MGNGQVPQFREDAWIGIQPEAGPYTRNAQAEIEVRTDELLAHMEFGSDYLQQKFANKFGFDEVCEGCHIEIGASLVSALN